MCTLVKGWSGLGVWAGEKPAVKRIMTQDIVRVLPWSGSGARLRHEVGTAEACTARVAASLVACALLYQNSIEVASAAALYWAWAPIWSTVLSNSLLRLRYRYAGIWSARVLEMQIVPPLESMKGEDLLGGIFNKLPVFYPTLQLLIGDDSPATFQMDVVMTEEVPGVQVGERVDVLVMSDKPSLSRFKALRDVYLPDRDTWISEEPYIERECFERLLRSPVPVVRKRNVQGKPNLVDGKLYLEETSTSESGEKWAKVVKSRPQAKQSRVFIDEDYEMDYQDDANGGPRVSKQSAGPLRTTDEVREKDRRLQELDERDLYL